MVLFKQELLAFRRGGSFLFVTLSILSWGVMMGSYPLDFFEVTTVLWVLFFSLVAAAGITSTVFIRERQSGTIEILLISGVSRQGLFLSKHLFSLLVVLVMGVCTLSVAVLISQALYFREVEYQIVAQYYVIFSAGALLMVSSSAWLSLALDNPRMVHLINFLLLSLVITLFMLLLEIISSLWVSLGALFLPLSLLFSFLGYRQLFKEKVLQPPLL